MSEKQELWPNSEFRKYDERIAALNDEAQRLTRELLESEDEMIALDAEIGDLLLAVQGVSHWIGCERNAIRGGSGIVCPRCERDDAQAEVVRLTAEKKEWAALSDRDEDHADRLRALLGEARETVSRLADGIRMETGKVVDLLARIEEELK